MRPDFLICNADAIGATHMFLKAVTKPSLRRSLVRPPLSTSGYILFQGVRGREARLGHHNIFFSDDYPLEFDEIHERKISPTEPTIYISVSARSDAAHAPEGCDNYFVLVNAPAREPHRAWTPEEATGYREVVMARLRKFGLELKRGAFEQSPVHNMLSATSEPMRVVAEKIFTPTDFAARDLAWHGSLYGWASHSIGASLFRPPLRCPGTRNVFFAGGTTHPGGGIPLVLLSGKMVAELIAREAA